MCSAVFPGCIKAWQCVNLSLSCLWISEMKASLFSLFRTRLEINTGVPLKGPDRIFCSTYESCSMISGLEQFMRILQYTFNSHDSSSQLCEPLALSFCCMLHTNILVMLHEIYISRKRRNLFQTYWKQIRSMHTRKI